MIWRLLGEADRARTGSPGARPEYDRGVCELLGMECNIPTDIVFSFSGLAARGGAKGPHADGWGLALYEGRAVRTFLEPAAASNSTLAAYIRQNPIKTLLAIAHVRQKTHGKISLANTHPFVRELWGRHFTFAHNGKLRGVKAHPLGRFRPIGDTDSELAFCAMMHRLDLAFPDGYPKEKDRLASAVAAIGADIGARGTFNFLLGDGVQLFARCATKLCFIISKAPFRQATLSDDDLTVDFASVTTPTDRVAVVATAPLTVDETWTMGVPGEMWVFRRGRLAGTWYS